MHRLIAATAATLVAASPLHASTAHRRPPRATPPIAHRGSEPGAGGHERRMLYGIGNGGQPFRATTTGGNAGGYTNRN